MAKIESGEYARPRSDFQIRTQKEREQLLENVASGISLVAASRKLSCSSVGARTSRAHGEHGARQAVPGSMGYVASRMNRELAHEDVRGPTEELEWLVCWGY